MSWRCSCRSPGCARSWRSASGSTPSWCRDSAGGADRRRSTRFVRDVDRARGCRADDARVRRWPGGASSESAAGLIDDRQARRRSSRPSAGARRACRSSPTWPTRCALASEEIPYSLVTGIDLRRRLRRARSVGVAPDRPAHRRRSSLNDWAARELHAKPGDRADDGLSTSGKTRASLATRSAEFTVAGIVPIDAGSRDLAPDYPGISDRPASATGIRRFRSTCAASARSTRTTGTVPHHAEGVRAARRRADAVAIALRRAHLGADRAAGWRSRSTARDPSIVAAARVGDRSAGVRAGRCATCAPRGSRRRRARPTSASTSSTSASFWSCRRCVLAVLFFKLGVEQRVREVGLLRAVGLSPRDDSPAVRRRGRWCSRDRRQRARRRRGRRLRVAPDQGADDVVGDAVGTTALTLHVSPGGAGDRRGRRRRRRRVCIWWTLRGLRHVSERSLLAGETLRLRPMAAARPRAAIDRRSVPRDRRARARGASRQPARLTPAAGVLRRRSGAAGVGADASRRLRCGGRRGASIAGRGWRPVSHLAARNAAHRPGRSVLSMAVIACATFILVTVDAFRRERPVSADDRTERHRRLRADGQHAAAGRPRSELCGTGARR